MMQKLENKTLQIFLEKLIKYEKEYGHNVLDDKLNNS